MTPIQAIQSRLAFLKDQAGLLLELHKQRGQRVGPKVAIRIEADPFVLRTAESADDRMGVFSLRYRVFHRELLRKRIPIGLDFDAFDFKCDHLLISHRSTGEIIGTYRMLCSLFVDRFYSSDEFDLTSIYRLPGIKLELGRACVDERFRNGAVLGLLWRGISEYIRRTDAQYLLGCSSAHTTDPIDVRCLDHHLRAKGYWSEVLQCPVMPEFVWNHDPSHEPEHAERRAQDFLPQLLSSYLRAGAKVCGGPAIDRAMGCADFLTLLKISDVHPAFAKRYQLWPG